MDPPDLPGVRHEHVNAGGLRTHVALAGPQDGPAVLLVHGWPQNWWAWRRVIPALSEHFRVIAPDLRGHGWTEATEHGYEKQQLADDLIAVLDELGVERTTWVGHDWGGWSGLLAALRAPGRIERMLTMSIPHLWTAPNPRLVATLLSYQVPLALPLLGKRACGPMSRALLQSGRGGERLSGADVAIFAEHIPANTSVAMYRTLLAREMIPVARGRYADAALTVPTTLIVGADDPVTRGTSAGDVQGQPQLSVRVLDSVAHWIPEQRPQAVIDWVEGR
jgi:pimeloyl-ACP methyl ester carboxylesterase